MKWATSSIEDLRAPAKNSLVGGPFGSDLTTRDYVLEGVPVIRGTNLPFDREFLDEGFAFVSEEKATRLSANLARPGDLVFTQRGTLGQVGLIPVEARFPRYLISQSQMKLSVDFKKADPRFVYYYFRLPTTVDAVVRRAITSGVPHINLGILRSFQVPRPPLEVQMAIVEELETYDDLIATNRRRIALLEEAARLIFREWFVRLRFPGHEGTKMVAGIPVGWERKQLDDVLTLKRGYDLPERERVDGSIPIVSSSGITGYHGTKKCDAPGVVTGRYGTLGNVYFIQEPYWPLNTALYVRDFKETPPAFAAHLLKHVLDGFQSDKAAVPGLDRNVVHRISILWPSRNLRDEFDSLASDFFRQTRVLELQNEKLRTARDLLLPKLMSGKIAV